MASKRNCRYSGIGGQAVLEGIMMKNKEKYAVAVRRPDGGVSVEVDNYPGILKGSKIKEIPFIRGIFNFIDSLALGMKCLNFSASFYEEEEGGEQKPKNETGEKLLSVLVTCFAVVLALGIFVVLPYYLTSLLKYVFTISPYSSRNSWRMDSMVAPISGCGLHNSATSPRFS